MHGTVRMSVFLNPGDPGQPFAVLLVFNPRLAVIYSMSCFEETKHCFYQNRPNPTQQVGLGKMQPIDYALQRMYSFDLGLKLTP